MTAGYDPSDPAVRAPYGDRPGPHPPRIEHTAPQSAVTGQFAAQPRLSPPPPPPSPPPAYGPAPQPVAGYGPAPEPVAGYGPAPEPVAGYGPAPQPVSAPTGFGEATPTSGFPAFGPVAMSAPPAGALPPVRPRGGRLGAVAFVLVLLLFAVVGVQSALLVNLGHRLDAAQRDARTARAESDSRLRGLESRAGALEKKGIDPQAVAKDVLPSVFRVATGKAFGTAFAVRKPASGGTDLITNNHVVDDVYRAGVRDVSLEHNDQRFPAKIVKVDPANDVALLHSDESFPRLVAATSSAQPGQPIVVVGAPLGLESTVTSGVVSALRVTPDGQMVQFDAPINPGNSGGPVVNAQRQVVGIATAMARGAAGIGFAIPISVACQSLGVC